MAYVLIVDDDEDFASAMSRIIRSMGYHVDVCTTYKEALLSIQRRKPDLLLLDIMFPENEFGGYRLLEALARLSKNLAKIPVLFLSATSQDDPLDKELLAGFDGVLLRKPVDFVELRNVVNSMTAGETVKSCN